MTQTGSGGYLLTLVSPPRPRSWRRRAKPYQSAHAVSCGGARSRHVCARLGTCAVTCPRECAIQQRMQWDCHVSAVTAGVHDGPVSRSSVTAGHVKGRARACTPGDVVAAADTVGISLTGDRSTVVREELLTPSATSVASTTAGADRPIRTHSMLCPILVTGYTLSVATLRCGH